MGLAAIRKIRVTDLPVGISVADVEAALGNLLNSASLRQSSDLCHLLTYVTREALAGRSREIKEYTLGAEILRRGTTFDPRVDTIVRVQARRLRLKLGEYYAKDGANDPVIIELPTGSYAPLFKKRDLPHTQLSKLGFSGNWVTLTSVVVLLLLVGASAAYVFRNLVRRDQPRTKLSSIVILPFTVVGQGRSDQYLGDVLCEDLISAFCRVKGLKVISRASAFRFRDKVNDVNAMRDTLHVATILEGTVRRIGEGLRVSAELINVSDSSQLWSDTYERDREDVQTIERDILNGVAVEGGFQTQLRPALTRLEHLSRTGSKTRNLYLQARFFWNKRTEQDLEKAIEIYKSIIAEDPRYPPAYAGLADAYAVLQNWGERKPSDIWPRARLAAQKAIALDDSLAECHVSLGHIKAVLEHDWTGAGTEFRRAMDLDPGSATAHFWYGALFLTPLGRLNEALQQFNEAMDLDPLAPNMLVMTGEIMRFRGRYDEARKYQEKALKIEPRSVAAYEALARTDILDRKFGDALIQLNHAQEIAPKRSLPLAYMVYAHAGAGNLRMARTLISRLHSRADHEYVSSFSLGTAHLALGEQEEAIRLLDKGTEEGAYYTSLLGVEPLYYPLYADVRFRRILKKIGLGVN